MPYYGLQLELTPGYDERTRLASWMTVFGKRSSFAGTWTLAILTRDRFLNPATGKGDGLVAALIARFQKTVARPYRPCLSRPRTGAATPKSKPL